MSLVGIDYHGQLRFADLAFEFFVVEMCSTSYRLFFHFYLNPMLQALNMDCSTRACASAGIEQEILFRLGLIKANFATINLLPMKIRRKFYDISITYGEFVL